MKKLFRSLLLLAVIGFSACTKENVPGLDDSQQSAFERDLMLVSTKAMSARGSATLQPYWDKATITPVFPTTPVNIDSLGVDPEPGPTPDPVDPEEEYNEALTDFGEIVWPVLVEHGAIEEFYEQNNDICVDSFFDEYGVFSMHEFLYQTTSPEFQYLSEQILSDKDNNYAVSFIAQDEELNKFEKIVLAYYIGYSAVAEMDTYMSEDEIGTKTTIHTTRQKYIACKASRNRAENNCTHTKNVNLFYAMAAEGAVAVLTGGMSALAQGIKTFADIIATGLNVGLCSEIWDEWEACMITARTNFYECLKK